MTHSSPQRRLSATVLFCIIAVPGLFCWLLLRRGYSPSLRRAGFTYAGVMAAVGILGGLGR